MEPVMADAETRQCSKCKVEKPLNGQHFASQLNGGYRWQCRECVSASLKAHIALRTQA